MAKKRYFAQFTVEIELDTRVAKAALTKGWRDQFYGFRTAEDVAGHVAFNMMRGCALNDIDGFANQDPKRARLIEILPGDVEENES